MRLFNLDRTPPPPPPAPQASAKPREKEGGSAPKNIRSQATPVVAPKPRIETPPVQKIAAAETPRQGSEPTQGASDVRGPGTGAGGTGNGTGSGNGGNGAGGAGGGVAEPPHLASPVLRGYDFPRGLLDQGPRGATVFLRLRVDPRGLVSECLVDRGTGVAAIDSVMCNLAHERLRFRPALDARGEPVAGWFGYAQPAPR
jgi:protein TonB